MEEKNELFDYIKESGLIEELVVLIKLQQELLKLKIRTQMQGTLPHFMYCAGEDGEGPGK